MHAETFAATHTELQKLGKISHTLAHKTIENLWKSM
jgi:hypothetical protein